MADQNTIRTSTLRKSAHLFCQALLSPPPPKELISKYFTSNPQITEHGPTWATSRLPFLGKTFSGVDGSVEYFNVLSETLKMNMTEDTFPGPEGFIVDIVDAQATTPDMASSKGSAKGVVSVVGQATFSSVKTGKSWDEKFIYRLSGFDSEGRIGHWEIWADPLSAWDAVGG
ncbi:hypothetical protein K402DRAFT_390562 [Aulographum hederae CBS 113979]|uniref:SnoaL-like domain-containing protein n=1 Tax=Aulographum hederae CBS 113979 TaxID=1176131 RepID=A0A6G1H9B1_9PEZI|nr:hypothetical protein K402DRAFT_390562 [Aulographum hederae CBS 113979]